MAMQMPRHRHWSTIQAAARLIALVLLTTATAAYAGEPRPWLCRDKPVFSTSSAAQMSLASHDSRRWQVFLMQFDPSGGHDGFTITESYNLEPGDRSRTENIEGGRFFAVALFDSGGRWICPAPAHDERTPGTLASLCYSAGGGPCDVTLTVRSAK
jgi:hypothetical protein